MKNIVYLFYYNDYLHLLKSIESFKLKSKILNENYDKYEIELDKFNSTYLIIYKNINLTAICCSQYKDICFLDIFKFFKKVNLLDKYIFNNLFIKKFTRNLCKLAIDIDILGDDEEVVEFNGYKLSESTILEDFEINNLNSLTKLKSYSIQPSGYKYLINVKSTNRLEFSKRFKQNEIEEILLELTFLIKSIN
ncbi:MAG: hypothetical protein E6Y31_09805 [Clostridium perfringens]|nr:hypothetical protein [Clostridium perfringens]MDU4829686.1 hypothetical protein [Clostridium perfringens]